MNAEENAERIISYFFDTSFIKNHFTSESMALHFNDNNEYPVGCMYFRGLHTLNSESELSMDSIQISKYNSYFKNKNTLDIFLSHSEEVEDICNTLFSNNIAMQEMFIVIQNKNNKQQHFFRHTVMLDDIKFIDLLIEASIDIWSGNALKKSIQDSIFSLFNVEYDLEKINIENLSEIAQTIKLLRY